MNDPLRADALAIWHAGLDAVSSQRLVQQSVSIEGSEIRLAGTRLPCSQIRRVAVVGAGKAGAGMALGLEQALGSHWLDAWHVEGWVNVPDDCVRPLQAIHLHPARPAGRNEPTEEGCRGSDAILRIVSQLGPDDLCIALISGGGSALLPAPVEGVSLKDKLQLTRVLSAAGASIQQLNTVRRCLSRIKGGGLARHCRAGHLVALIISDVIGDPLDLIASGPTVLGPPDPAAALEVLHQLGLGEEVIPANVFDWLRRQAAARATPPPPTARIGNYIIGNNATAVVAASSEAARRGYAVQRIHPESPSTTAEQVGVELARRIASARGQKRCIVWGGEPVVRLAPVEERGKGGRNQQLVLAAYQWLRESGVHHLQNLVLLSGGTDGEDGPTDAAGALLDDHVAQAALAKGLDAASLLKRNDAYRFFEQTGGLIVTGPTGTNVGDLRIALVRS